jgi:LPXTG-site transpeptidase (sortase) family protein
VINHPTQRAVAIVAAALLGVGAAWLTAPRERSAAADLPRVTAAGAPSGGENAEPRPEARDEGAPPAAQVRSRPATVDAANQAISRAVAPTRVSVPSVGISMPVRPVGVDRAGLMALPESAFTAGWYRFGRGPLDRSGTTVLAGHVDTVEEGVGPLSRLSSVRVGADVRLRAGGREVTYRVERVQRVAKSVLDLPRLFARGGPARLQLVTCGGEYLPDSGGYQDNVVVTARRVG